MMGATLACLVLTGCGGKSDAPPAKPAAPTQQMAPAARPDPMQITVDETLGARLSIQGVSTQSIAETIRLPGRLEANPYKTARVGAPIPGRITQIDVLFGQQVRQGQVLAELGSPELAQAQLGFLRAHSQVQLLTRAVERAELLLASDVIGPAELQRRQSELTVAIAEKRAASDQLLSLGMGRPRIETLERTGQIQSRTSVVSPLSGTVIERNVAQGQMVSPSDVMFLVSDLSHLWASAEVPEQDARFVQRGQRVVIEVPALDDAQIAGRVTHVADIVDPQTRTVRVLVDVDNSQRRLKPSMLITMLIEGRVAPAQVIPASAVVRDNDRDHVFLEVGPSTFRMVPVELSPERSGRRALTKPLPDEARIIVDGAFHVNNVRIQRAADGR